MSEFTQMAQQVGDFYTEHGRLPSAFNRDFRELRLGQWLDSQRTAKKEGRLPLPLQAQLSAKAPGWSR